MLGNVFAQFDTPLPFSIVAFLPLDLKSQSIGPIKDVVTLPRALHIPEACFEALYLMGLILLLLQLCV